MNAPASDPTWLTPKAKQHRQLAEYGNPAVAHRKQITGMTKQVSRTLVVLEKPAPGVTL
jgi:hypothetical protein